MLSSSLNRRGWRSKHASRGHLEGAISCTGAACTAVRAQCHALPRRPRGPAASPGAAALSPFGALRRRGMGHGRWPGRISLVVYSYDRADHGHGHSRRPREGVEQRGPIFSAAGIPSVAELRTRRTRRPAPPLVHARGGNAYMWHSQQGLRSSWTVTAARTPEDERVRPVASTGEVEVSIRRKAIKLSRPRVGMI